MNRPTTPAIQRLAEVMEAFSLSEPLFYAALSSHPRFANDSIDTIRVGAGRLEFNPEFVRGLSPTQLRDVMSVEAMRILLAHPYQRRLPEPDWMLAASNLTIQEYLRTDLPIPQPQELLGDDALVRQSYETYYQELASRSTQNPPEDSDEGGNDSDDCDSIAGQNADGGPNDAGDPNDAGAPEDDGVSGEAGNASPSGDEVSQYADAAQVGGQNTELWDTDDLRCDEAVDWIRDADLGDRWGSIGPIGRERLRAGLRPNLDYRRILHQFRKSVRGQRRHRTRMKPSRRYGFSQLGSRYRDTTRLLFAVDVSGSMSSEDLVRGFSVISGFFCSGVEAVDVVAFDTVIRGGVRSLRKARSSFEIEGRGGTNLQSAIDFADQSGGHDGVIIFTDGHADPPVQTGPARFRVLWLLTNAHEAHQSGGGLSATGQIAVLRP